MSADVEERSGQPSSHADSPASTSARPSAAARNPRIRQRPAVAVTKQRTVTQSTAPTGGKQAKTKQDGSTESLQSHNKTAANGPASSSQFVSKQFSTKRPAGETISGAKLVELAQLAVQDAAKMKDLEQMSHAQPDLYAQLILEVFKSTQDIDLLGKLPPPAAPDLGFDLFDDFGPPRFPLGAPGMSDFENYNDNGEEDELGFDSKNFPDLDMDMPLDFFPDYVPELDFDYDPMQDMDDEELFGEEGTWGPLAPPGGGYFGGPLGRLIDVEEGEEDEDEEAEGQMFRVGRPMGRLGSAGSLRPRGQAAEAAVARDSGWRYDGDERYGYMDHFDYGDDDNSDSGSWETVDGLDGAYLDAAADAARGSDTEAGEAVEDTHVAGAIQAALIPGTGCESSSPAELQWGADATGIDSAEAFSPGHVVSKPDGFLAGAGTWQQASMLSTTKLPQTQAVPAAACASASSLLDNVIHAAGSASTAACKSISELPVTADTLAKTASNPGQANLALAMAVHSVDGDVAQVEQQLAGLGLS